mgnify:CR=1 FL=1
MISAKILSFEKLSFYLNDDFLRKFKIKDYKELLISSSQDAYIAVTSFVGATLLVFYTLEKKNFNIPEYINEFDLCC